MEHNKVSQCVNLISPLIKKEIQCIGKYFIKYYTRHHNDGMGLINSENSSTKVSDQDLDIDIDIEFLRSLDPKEWKDQDHYAVLGLKKYRFDASDDDIKRAYRKIVLKHHPDKRKAQGEEIKTEDDYFTCITRAYEILGNPQKRRSYDSVDPEFDDALPTTSEINKEYFQVFAKCFALNARWSEKKKVPEFGDENAMRNHVEHFYNFWYNFDSWREYSYLDEEDKEKGQDRDERRWIEKQNKVIRAKRKKEEMSRIRSLVDLAYNNDPRIIRFKQEEKDKKLAAKMAKLSAAQAQKAEEERIIKEAQEAKLKAEQAEQKRIESIRLEKEQQKRVLKRERKTTREIVKSNNYYASENDDKLKIKNMEGVEKICEMLKIMELQEFNKALQEGGREVFNKTLKEIEIKLEEERKAMFSTKSSSSSGGSVSVKAIDKTSLWSSENMQILIKAVNLFPAGTIQRWEVIANFMNQHGTILNERKFLARDVLNKAKDLQSGDFSKNVLKVQANENAFSSFEKSKKELKMVDNSEISVNTEDKVKTNGVKSECASKTKESYPPAVNAPVTTDQLNSETTSVIKEDSSKTWTKEEQALLEQAIKTYPITTQDRWDRVAECIPNRTKKECLRRVKELVDQVNAKKKAQQIK